MATLKEDLRRLLGPSKGGNPSKGTSPSPYGIERAAAPREGQRQVGLFSEAEQHADLARQWAAEKAAREGTETDAQWTARTGQKPVKSPYGLGRA